MKYRRPRGTKDILPDSIYKWHFVEKTIHEVMNYYSYYEIRTPTFEYTDLFIRGVGSDTDIVGKEMYTFDDKGGDSLTLKPEGTAPVMRAYLENSLSAESPLQKVYYITQMFRYEKPQAGRYREHTQFGAEIIGSDDIFSDLELISLASSIYKKCGIQNFKLKINTIGKTEERKSYVNLLKEYFKKHYDELSNESKIKLEKNPLRILDSKNENDKMIIEKAPKITEYLGKDSQERFNSVMKLLQQNSIEFELDSKLVRGLDYYTDTTFEFISKDLGAQDAIGGGGRYDGLAEMLGGKNIPGIGFGSGIERVILAAEKGKFIFPKSKGVFVFFISLNNDSKELSSKFVDELRGKGIVCEFDLLGRSLKSQMREANKIGAEYTYIIGENEIKSGSGILKNMLDSSQKSIEIQNIVNFISELNENKKS